MSAGHTTDAVVGALDDVRLLQTFSTALIQEDGIQGLYEQLLDAAVTIMRSDCASMQVLCADRGFGGELLLLASHGFTPDGQSLWKWVRRDSETTCAAALRTGVRVVVPDLERCDFMSGTRGLGQYLAAGIHAAQTTPLRSRDGRILGMISTHWRQPHEPAERDLRLLDILARQAADLIERRRRDDLLAGQRAALEMLATGAPLHDVLSALVHLVEAQSAVLVSSVLVRDPDGERFQTAVGPSLPAAYVQAIGQAPIVPPYRAPCGRAAHLGETVIVDDIATDTRWPRDWRMLAARHGLRTCHAAPIRASGGQLVGAFGFYSYEPRDARGIDAELLEVATHLAGIAIEQKQAEAALRQSESDLRHANRIKDDFLAVLSHELRTPLNAIVGWSQMLVDGSLPERARPRAVESIRRNARAQAQLVDDLLDISRIVSGNLQITTGIVDLGAVISGAVETVGPAAAAKGLALGVIADPLQFLVRGDSARLQQIAWNLLANAVRFTPAGGRIDLTLRRLGANVELIVSDTGCGISPGFLPHVFERFRQADSSTTRTHGGLGLGLAIVRHLVDAHGGTVSAESAGEGRGATFTVSLPAASAVLDTPDSSVEHVL